MDVQRQKEMENERNGDVESAQTLLKSKCSKVCFKVAILWVELMT